MEPKFTPGPWELVANSWAITTIYDSNREVICKSNISHEATEENQSDLESVQSANMHLIAAAPDMYEALKLSVRQNSHDMLLTGEEIRMCEAALAKVRGEVA